jgi:hypothetical protein
LLQTLRHTLGRGVQMLRADLDNRAAGEDMRAGGEQV